MPTEKCPWDGVPSGQALIVTLVLAALHGGCHGVQDRGAIRVLVVHTIAYWAMVQSEPCHQCGELSAVLPAAIANCVVYFAVAYQCSPKVTIEATGDLTQWTSATKMNEEHQAHIDFVVGGGFVAIFACILLGAAAAMDETI
tara:strand:+ start:175 stop:600 length:426 start_codon:yes stop_codon:yes gene_type:complete